ncbi:MULTISPECIES: response regulator transcription factor [unclassified Cupriavidus]|uniref:response regulator transcription factor n=1 Tax=unclassified Cupriavidus TaxID=2640874 RepID=UPI001C003FDC|nr:MULTISPECIES: response regulator transcription factor [unclassified Cupriavidus]MCA3187790.1 response regulator transcription factor [Cupriavidus sp.]MCA3193788.1 response regulator transcription factor [Cupriavidus sp.]MCA3196239.1 response regulator transcription factor [Cupriavidus sp.]MCA3203760.1 response regulator transcription factor [Cupriavidus sp.]MCA3205966.1 response regulator transcription factor [Cupriavidus sp.]
MRVLIVEDDPRVRHWLGTRLQQNGHDCRLTDTGEQALELIRDEAFDAVLLDRMLPGIDGIEVLRALADPHPPVMVLSAVDQPCDRVEGLRAGAGDYLGKPFDFTELLLRLEGLAKWRALPAEADWITRLEDLCIDWRARRVSRGGQPIDLTEKEFALLQVLATNAGRTVTRAMLLEKVWGYQFDPQTNLIDVHVSKLRSKIDRNFSRSLLRTVRAVGYVLG